jgi:hypothetical protein
LGWKSKICRGVAARLSERQRRQDRSLTDGQGSAGRWLWSISLYNAKGFFEKDDLNAYSLNNLTAKPNADGSFTIQFGGCQKVHAELPSDHGGVELHREPLPTAQEIIDATWKFPEAQPVN